MRHHHHSVYKKLIFYFDILPKHRESFHPQLNKLITFSKNSKFYPFSQSAFPPQNTIADP